APGWPPVIERLRSDRLNARDAQRQERGYYEHLINVNIGGSVGLIDAPPDPPDWITQNQAGLMRDRPDFLLEELRPDQDMIYKRARFQTNRWGMRDRDYPLAKPEGTVRIAVLGASHVMGTGVANGETFPDVLEERLNATAGGPRYEVLNFASGGLSPLDHLYLLETKVAGFHPDVVVYVMQEDVEHFAAIHLADVVQLGVEIPYAYLRDLVERLEVNQTTSPEVILQRLTPHAAQIETWAESSMAEAIRAMAARPIAVYLPRTQRAAPADQIHGILRRVVQAGYDTIDLHAVYQGYDVDELSVAAWDRHPNPLAHGLIAERILVELQHRPELFSAPQQVVVDGTAPSNLTPVSGGEPNGSGR
ncbi:MAG: SGNH/GDSL hydrolase family protein, partial [Longimicrobiales bacterium]